MGSSSAWIPRLDRWAGLSAAMIMMGCAGLTYTYAVYSEHMKQRLHFSQEQVDDIGAAKDFGGVVALASGIFYSLYPPWVTIAIGAALHLYGYSMVWMTIAGKVAPSFWLLCVYSAVGNGGDGWIDTACMMTSLQNYEEHRGTAMGILKAQVGLSGAIFVMIYEALIEPDVNKFLLLMSLVPTIASLLLAYFIKPFPLRKDDDGFPAIRFRMTFITIVILGVYMMLSMACEEYFQVKRMFQRASIVLMLAIMLTMYALPLVRFPPRFLHGPLERIVASEGIDLPKLTKKDSEVADISEEEASGLLNPDSDPEDTNLQGTHASNHAVHVTLRESIADFNFWLIFIVVTIGAGTGVAIFNNFAQIGKALRAGGTDIYVGLISIWSCFGRLGSGYGSDHLMRHGYPRTLCLLITQISMALCCLLLATGLLPSLFLGSALTGLTYGAYWTLVPAILSEVFGLHNFTVLYKLVSLGPPLGSYLLSAKVMGYLYDEEAVLYHQHSSASDVGAIPGVEDGNTCYGVKCFGFGLLALSFVSFIGASASFFLFLGTRAVYNKTKQTNSM